MWSGGQARGSEAESRGQGEAPPPPTLSSCGLTSSPQLLHIQTLTPQVTTASSPPETSHLPAPTPTLYSPKENFECLFHRWG